MLFCSEILNYTAFSAVFFAILAKAKKSQIWRHCRQNFSFEIHSAHAIGYRVKNRHGNS
jgi:hypothetical protein